MQTRDSEQKPSVYTSAHVHFLSLIVPDTQVTVLMSKIWYKVVHVFPTYPSSSTTIAPNRHCTLIVVLLLEPAEEVKRQNGYVMRVFTKLSFLRTMSHYC